MEYLLQFAVENGSFVDDLPIFTKWWCSRSQTLNGLNDYQRVSGKKPKINNQYMCSNTAGFSLCREFDKLTMWFLIWLIKESKLKIILGTSSKNQWCDFQKSIHWCIHVKLGQKPALTFGSRSEKVIVWIWTTLHSRLWWFWLTHAQGMGYDRPMILAGLILGVGVFFDHFK